MTLNGDRDAVADAVRRYFAAWAVGDPTENVAVATRAAADALLARARPPREERSVEIHRVDVDHIGTDAAVVALDAALVRRVGERSHETPLSGPVEVRREHDAWKVAGFHRQGRPVASSLLNAVTVRAGSVEITPRLLEFRGDSTGVVLEARNEGDEDATFVGVKVVGHIFIAFGRRISQGVLRGTIPAKETIFREALVPPLPKPPDRLVLRVQLKQGGRTHKKTVEVARPHSSLEATRLDHVAPQLVQRFRRASDDANRRVAAAVAAAALRSVDLDDDPRLRDGERAHQSDADAGPEREALAALRDQLDDRYREIEEATGADDESDGFFRAARAVSALQFALDPDPFNAAVEATVEAIAAVADERAVLDIASEALDG